MSHITVFIVSLPANTFSAVSPRSSLSHGKIIPKQPLIKVKFNMSLVYCDVKISMFMIRRDSIC